MYHGKELPTMNPVTHPFVKTSQDLRRSINRLDAFCKTSPEDEQVKNGNVGQLIEQMKGARLLIPASLRDADLAER